MVTVPPSPSTPQFIALNGLRGIAALVVVQRHGYYFLGDAMLPGGYMAVDFFFLLSGFVLAHAYDERLRSGLTATGFLRARLIRLYPLYLLGLLLTLPLALTSSDHALAWFAAGLLFLPDFWVSGFSWLVPASWSLAAELAVNLPFALFHRWLTTRALVITVAAALVALAAMAFTRGAIDAGSTGADWAGGLLRVFFSFPLGVLLYRHRRRLGAWAPGWATWPAMALLIGLLAVPAPAGLVAWRDLAIVTIGLPALLLFAAGARPGEAASGISTALGELSYPIYVLHAALFGLCGWLLVMLGGPPLETAPIWIVALVLFTIVALCLVLAEYVDRPLRRAMAGQPPAPTPPAL